jgi:hypothetical protein
MASGGEQLWVDGYVRLSDVAGRKGERFVSPAVQRQLILGWTTSRGVQVLEIFEELDESGRRPDRPLLEKALRPVENGISQGIVVSKVSRLGRSLLSGIAAMERTRAAGGRFVAVQNDLIPAPTRFGSSCTSSCRWRSGRAIASARSGRPRARRRWRAACICSRARRWATPERGRVG